ATRARQRLHLVSQIQCKQGQVVEPARGSLLSRLFALFELTPPAQQASAEAATAGESAPGVQGPPLSRIATETLMQLPVVSGNTSVAGAAAAGWQFDDKYEASIGTVTHAWLARIGQDHMQSWDAARLQAAREIIVRQLENEGLRQAQARTGGQRVYDLLSRCLASEKCRWLLSHAQARQELPLTSMDGKLLIVDVAVSTEAGWLVVDFKTGERREHEPQDVFEARMRDTCRLQLQGY